MRARFPALAFALATAAGCVAGGDDSPAPPPDDDPAPVVPDGTRGTIKVRLDSGIVDAPYIVEGGRMIWQGDIDLGPATEASVYGFAIVGQDYRWPDGIINFRFNAPFPAATEQAIRDAMTQWSDVVPITFKEGVDSSRPFIGFNWHLGAGSSTTGVGPDDIDPGDETDVNINLEAGMAEVMHELGHAMGLMHEHMRPDRGAHVLFREGCVGDEDDVDQFDVIDDDDYKEMGEYDVHSIMHYSSTTWCGQAFDPLPETDHGGCWCYPLLNLDTYDGVDEETGYFTPSSTPTQQDQRVVTRMYEPVLGVVEAGDEFGSASAVGDFDDDGFPDLAVGAPGEERGGKTTGAVLIYRGTANGLVAWGFLDESSTSAVQNNDDDYGFALAAGDLDNDGRDDLVVGAPGNRMGVGADTGQVFVYLSAEGGPFDHDRKVKALSQNSTGVGTSLANERFGAALAVGDVNDDGKTDLAIGVPGEINSGVKSGYAHTFKWQSSTQSFVAYDGVKPPSTNQAADDKFGTAIAIVDVTGDGKRDLVVGAPSTLTSTTRSGQVFVYVNGPSTFSLNQTLAPDSPVAGDRFGAAIVSSQTLTSWPDTKTATNHQPQIFIGAPGRDNPSDSGRVFRYTPSFGIWDAYTGLVKQESFGQASVPGLTNQAGDAFGAALAVADFDGDDVRELLVGAAKKDLLATDAGLVAVFKSSSGYTNGGKVGLLEPGVSGWGADRFGADIAVGDFDSDGKPDVVVGAPGRASDAGRIYAFTGPSSGVIPSFDHLIDQDTATPE